MHKRTLFSAFLTALYFGFLAAPHDVAAADSRGPALVAPTDEEQTDIFESGPHLHTDDENDAGGSFIPDEDLPDLTFREKQEPRVVTPPPPILRDFSALPAPVQATRDALMRAARSGKVEALRGLLREGPDGTTLSLGGIDGDPIDFLREASGDEEGYELLAILLEVLEAGYVHMGDGTQEEMYVWPYFVAWPLDQLTPENRVELFRLLTAGDVQDSEQFGSYIFYRVGIRPDGEWRFFVAGD